MTSPPMTKRLAFRELVVLGAAYAIGLWAILIGLTDLPAGQITSLLVGLGVFIASSAALFLVLSRGRLSLDLGRPLRYWIPAGVAVVVAVWWSAPAGSHHARRGDVRGRDPAAGRGPLHLQPLVVDCCAGASRPAELTWLASQPKWVLRELTGFHRFGAPTRVLRSPRRSS